MNYTILYKFIFCFNIILVLFSCKPEKQIVKQNAYNYVEEIPQFPGGEIAMFKFIEDSLKHPLSNTGEKLEGKVFVGFVVDIDGSIKNVKVRKSTNPNLENEAVQVIKKMPKWKAGKVHDKFVETTMTLPVEFKK